MILGKDLQLSSVNRDGSDLCSGIVWPESQGPPIFDAWR